MDIASSIKIYINKSGIMQSYIADKAGIRRDSFCALLNGKRKIAIDEYCRICAVLGVEFDFFIKATDNSSANARSSA